MKKTIYLAITLLICSAQAKLLLRTPFTVKSDKERVADDATDFKSYISPDLLKELENYQEDMRYSQIQNEKDDDEIYSFGLKGQQNPSLLVQNKKYISGYSRLMNIASRINEFYNRFKGVNAPEEMDVAGNLNDGLAIFEITKTLTLTIVYEFSELNAELEDALKHLSFVDGTPLECIEFMGFKPRFTNILKTHDQTTADFVDLQHKLELRTYDFVTKGRLFMQALFGIRHFDRLIFSFFNGFDKTVKLEDEDMDNTEKINTSVSIVNKSLDFKNVIAEVFAGITSGIANMNTVREDIDHLLIRMEELPKIGEVLPVSMSLESVAEEDAEVETDSRKI
jgi:hypothetical protein